MLPGLEHLKELMNEVKDEDLSENDRIIKDQVIKDIEYISNLNTNDPKDLQKELGRILAFYAKFEKGPQ